MSANNGFHKLTFIPGESHLDDIVSRNSMEDFGDQNFRDGDSSCETLVRAQEYSVLSLYPDYGAYRTPCTAILLFQACPTFRTTGREPQHEQVWVVYASLTSSYLMPCVLAFILEHGS